MRQKELRIALVCYGGISLAVYMHGVTKELWKLARASRAFHAEGQDAGVGALSASEAVYRDLLRHIACTSNVRLRVLLDIVAGASAGGINGVFLAQAIHSGQSLEPLTHLWLSRADVDVLLDPDARAWSRWLKYWAVPVVRFMLSRPGNMVSQSVAPEARAEVRGKLSRLIRSRWFEPPFGGIGFSRLLAEALDAMAGAALPAGAPLLPAGHPLDLFVTATDFAGHLASLRLHSPPRVEESEHRLSIGFAAPAPAQGGEALAPLLELVLAARATASFPGAFPPLHLGEIDRLAAERGDGWPSRERFVARIMPRRAASGTADHASLIDGSVLVNAPFAEAMRVLGSRPAQREVDRRFIYIDPCPQMGDPDQNAPPEPSFFSVVFGSLSSIPREQPVRDNLEELARHSRETAGLRAIVSAMRPEVEAAVVQVFGYTLFLDRPTERRMANWRAKAERAATDSAGFAYQGYARIRVAGVLTALALRIASAAPQFDAEAVEDRLRAHLAGGALAQVIGAKGGLAPAAAEFLRDHDLADRIRRLRLLVRRLSQQRGPLGEVSDAERQQARDAVFRALALYFDRDGGAVTGPGFPALAARVMLDPAAVLAGIAVRRDLAATDRRIDQLLSAAMADMRRPLRRLVLLTYLGHPFYDVATLPLLRGRDVAEFDAIKVDRISPEDARSIRPGGAAACLRGVEFFNFGAFFSRAYRENDYLWGRLHGAERMIDIVASGVEDIGSIAPGDLARFKRAAFLAILDEEEPRLLADPALVPGIRAEVLRQK